MQIATAPRQLLLACAISLLAAFDAWAGPVRLNVEAGQGVLPASGVQRTYLRIGLEGIAPDDAAERPPVNVALVLDRSGSMQGPRLAQAKDAAILALDSLRPADTVAVVAYDDAPEVLMSTEPFLERQYAEQVIRSIRANGRTALYGGVVAGAEELRKYRDDGKVNRIVLLSDGMANVGPSTPSELGQLGRTLGEEGMAVTTIGLGLGYNEDLMARLADASDGNHVFAESPEELAAIFRSEFGELTGAVAVDVVITVQCRNGVRPLRALGREAVIEGDRARFRLHQLNPRQEKYLLLEVEVPPGQDGAELVVAEVSVSYVDLGSKQRDRLEAKTRARYSDSAEKSERSVNTSVMVSAAEQIGAAMGEEALRLKDKGDTEGAKAALRQKTEHLEQQASRLSSERLREQGQNSQKAEAAVAAPAASDAWSSARKSMVEDALSIKKQQSYR